MNAITIIKTLIICEPALTTAEAADNILNELHRLKRLKGTPFFAVRRAIRIQERIVNNLNK